MNYEIVTVKEKWVAGIGVTTTNQEGKGMQDIGKAWKDFFETGMYERLEGKINAKTIGLYTDYEGDYTKPYLFIACAEIKEPTPSTQGITIKKIKEGTYAKYEVIGGLEKVGEVWGEIWNTNLNRAYDTDFEEYEYLEDNTQKITIYISLKK